MIRDDYHRDKTQRLFKDMVRQRAEWVIVDLFGPHMRCRIEVGTMTAYARNFYETIKKEQLAQLLNHFGCGDLTTLLILLESLVPMLTHPGSAITEVRFLFSQPNETKPAFPGLPVALRLDSPYDPQYHYDI